MNLLLVSILFFNTVVGVPYECGTGFWGSQCQRECGHCEGGAEFCHIHDGRCVNGCAAGFSGSKCKTECPEGTHGQYCVHRCGECSDVSPICHAVTGECEGGCKPGFQKPFCKLPCPHMTWGENCEKQCTCTDAKCGCNHQLGYCNKCDANGKPKDMILKDPSNLCINRFVFDLDVNKGKVRKRRLEIPWVPILTFLGLIATFVATKFLYWYCWVRAPKTAEIVKIVRGERPQLERVQSWTVIRDEVDHDNRQTSRPKALSFRNQDLDVFMDKQAARLAKQEDLFYDMVDHTFEPYTEPHHQAHQVYHHQQHHHTNHPRPPSRIHLLSDSDLHLGSSLGSSSRSSGTEQGKQENTTTNEKDE